MKVKNDHSSKFSNLSNWKEEARKNQGSNPIEGLSSVTNLRSAHSREHNVRHVVRT